uniref:Uncharacterized protein n=1 Tax=Populus trichocarpa TaxID=3694 RepID=A0A2K1ZKA0_POPTR
MTAATFISLSCLSLDTRFLRRPFRFVSSLCFGDLLETSWKMSKNLLLLCAMVPRTLSKKIMKRKLSFLLGAND